MPNPAPHEVSFLEIGSSDAAATRAFFNAIFDWPCHDNAWLQSPTVRVGVHGGDTAPQIYVYFHVQDIQAAMARIRAAGGEADEPTYVPGFGTYCNCRDPGGAAFGLHNREIAGGNIPSSGVPSTLSRDDPPSGV
jgi:predicted enzyme related to lactoylglutathione lyase